MHHICENGYEHYVASDPSPTAAALEDALGSYPGWDVYLHDGQPGKLRQIHWRERALQAVARGPKRGA